MECRIWLPILFRLCVVWIVVKRVTPSQDTREGQKQGHSSDSDGYQEEISSDKTDWNDHSAVDKDLQRKGPGEHGQPLFLTYSEDEQILANGLEEAYGYSAFISNHISVARAIPDARSDTCKKHLFLKDLPEKSVSVIIPFRNEHNWTLLRTVHSVFRRTPAVLLKEVILVDDDSDNWGLRIDLRKYVGEHFDRVKIITNERKLGEIRSKVVGADASTGSMLLFLDARVEVGHNYLPPLLEPIILNYRTIVCPTLDTIRRDTFEIVPTETATRDVFSWNMQLQRLPVWERNLRDITEPFPTPIMEGPAFAISRRWWEEIGRLDPGLKMSGGDNFELSFKSWQCGGSVVKSQCSRVAHLEPLISKYAHTRRSLERMQNIFRVASVWMDEYKDLVVQRIPFMVNENPGDLTEQNEIRKRLKCKTFQWFMEKVAPDILYNWPPQDPPLRAWGKISNKKDSSLCLTKEENLSATVRLHLKSCNKTWEHYDFTWKNTIMFYTDATDQCLTSLGDEHVSLQRCIHNDTIQEFAWNRESGHMVSLKTRLCLDADLNDRKVYLDECRHGQTSQSWSFEHVNTSATDVAWKRAMVTDYFRDEL